MEEVWNDITLTSLHDHNRHRHSAAAGHAFLDFLSAENQPPPQSTLRSPPPPPSAVALRLNSGPDDHHFNSFLEGQLLRPVSNASCFDVSLEGLASASSLPCLHGKGFPEPVQNSGDRRHKRMIKNRESAARSRARKQAYTNELELEVAQLMEENAKLKKQQQQLCLASAAQVSKKNTLHRSSTAPF